MRTWITERAIDPADVLASVGGPEDGAAVLFIGTVRGHNAGRAVSGMRYEAYREMAERELAAIAGDVCRQTDVTRLVAVHRIGELTVGEISVAVAVSSPHRAQSFDAARAVIEGIKQRLPVWKHEHYVEGGARWLEGTLPPVPGGRS